MGSKALAPPDAVRAAWDARRLPPTPLVRAGDQAWLKLENLQPTGSFKVRGFFNAARLLAPEQLKDGIVTVSAGNAALAAAYVARDLGVPCTVVMFDNAPLPKREGVERLGAEILAWPRERVVTWIADRGWEQMRGHFIHPFADPDVVAGHSTLGLEIREQLPQVARVVVPVGGGGLILGVAAGLRLKAGAGVEIVGVQAEGYPLWARTFAEGEPPQISPHTIADGTSAPYVEAMRGPLEAAVDRWLVVPESILRQAVRQLALGHKVVAEGSGALAMAALPQLEPRPTVLVVSGGNIDAGLLSSILAEPAG
jgi:threonine dehydratase